MASLGDILSITKQVGIVQETLSGLPVDGMPSALLNTFNDDFEGNKGSYMRVLGARDTAKFKEYGAKGHTANPEDVSEEQITLLSSGEEKAFNAMDIVLLKGGDPGNIARLETKMDNERENFIARFTYLRISAVCSVIATGKVSYDSDYNLLPTDSGAFNTIDFGIPATNQGDIDGIISASWATATTDIPAQVQLIKRKSVTDTGFQLTTALYGANILTYLAKNENVSAQWAGQNSNMSDEILRGNIPQGMLGIRDWMYFGDAYYIDSAGVKQFWIDDDAIIFIPDVTSAWYEIGQGTTPVASTWDMQNGITEALNSISILRGMYGYAYVDQEMRIKWAHGDCFCPILKNADVVYIADTTP